MKEERHAAQVNAGLAPPDQPVDHGRENGDTRRRVKHSRNS